MPAIDIQGNSLIELNPGKPPKQLPGVYALEPLKGYWSGKSDWGRRFQGEFPQSAGVEINITRITEMPGPPRARTILLGRKRPLYGAGGIVGGINGGIRAKVYYGCGGHTNVFYTDWINGTNITVVATSIQILAESYIVDPANAYTPEPDDLDVNASIGIQSATSGVSATYTESRTAAGVGIEYLNVPQFANRVSILGQFTTPATTIFRFYSEAANFSYTGTQILALMGQDIPLPGDVKLITVATVAGASAYSLRFGLCV